MIYSNAALTGGYVQPQPTHWFWIEDVPKGARFLSLEECQRLGIQPHENRLAGNDVPAVLFSTAYHLLVRDAEGERR